MAQGPKSLEANPYKNDRWGFAITPFTKWDLIPAQPDEQYTIVKFVAPQDITEPKLGLSYRAEFTILRFDPTGKSSALLEDGKTGGKGNDGPTTGTPSGEAEAELKKLRDELSYKTFDQYFAKMTGVAKTKEETIKAGKLEAKVVHFTSKTSVKNVINKLAFIFTTPEKAQYVVIYEMLDRKYEDWKPLFYESAKSFRLIKATNDDPDRFKNLTPIQADRLRHREDCDRSGWNFAETEHFFIKYNIDKADFIRDVKERVEAIRKVFVKDFGDREMTEIPVLRICKNMDEYSSYGGPPGSGGYWNSNAKELVVPCFKEFDIKLTWAVMNHEAFHQFIYYRCGKLDPHSWYNEGTGDYYAGMVYEGAGKFRLRTMSTWAAGIDRLSTIKEAIKKEDYVPLDKILRYSQGEYYSRAGLCYAEGWSIVYFLREGKKEGATPWRAEWDRLLKDYFDVLNETKDAEKAVETAFRDLKGDKMAEFEKSWKEFIKKLK